MMGEIDFRHALHPSRAPLASVDPYEVFSALDAAGVADLYPGFDRWFFSKVVPGWRSGDRKIFTERDGDRLIGVAICKWTDEEQKLCTLWVAPEARGRRVATRLADEAFYWLDTSKPLFTAPQELVADFSSLLRSWSFPAAVAHAGAYRPAVVEYAFNGCLRAD